MNSGVFTTIRLVPEPQNLDLHYKRLQTTSNIQKVDFKYSYQQFEKLIEDNCKGKEVVKVIVTNQGISFEFRQLPQISQDYKLKSKTNKSEISKMKRYPNSKQLEELTMAKELGYDEYLEVVDNNITETTICNIFLIVDNKLYTPKLNDNILNGTIRQKICNNYKVIEKDISLTELLQADAVFVTNSLKIIQPVTIIDNWTIETNYDYSRLRAQLLK